MKEPNQDKMFEFMLKEYEMLYSKFEMHYNAVEKTIGLYFLIIGAVVSANSLFIKDDASFSIFSLSEFQISCCFFISIVGTIVLLKVIEHRLLIITYVKNLNQNRKWFNENIANKELQKYSLFETSYKSPKYFKKYRHFYWEVMGIAITNCSFFALLIINLFKLFNIRSIHSNIINWAFFIIIVYLGTIMFLKLYQKRAKDDEAKLNQKNLA